MLYQWDCKKCGKQIEVMRKVDDRDVPPEEGCEICGCTDFTRVVSGGTGFFLLGNGWFNKGGY